MRSLVAVALMVAGFPAAAMDMSIRGAVLTMSGKVEFGDDVKLNELLRSPQGAGVRIVHLHNSPGGWINPMIEMARNIREKRLTTVVDGGRGFCDSACTGLFVAGVSRHYINAATIDPKQQKVPRGLGFHEGSTPFSGRQQYSGAGTAQMINVYYEMGVGGAARIVSNATFRGIYRIPGQQALALGIATSLSPP